MQNSSDSERPSLLNIESGVPSSVIDKLKSLQKDQYSKKQLKKEVLVSGYIEEIMMKRRCE